MRNRCHILDLSSRFIPTTGVTLKRGKYPTSTGRTHKLSLKWESTDFLIIRNCKNCLLIIWPNICAKLVIIIAYNGMVYCWSIILISWTQFQNFNKLLNFSLDLDFFAGLSIFYFKSLLYIKPHISTLLMKSWKEIVKTYLYVSFGMNYSFYVISMDKIIMNRVIVWTFKIPDSGHLYIFLFLT